MIAIPNRSKPVFCGHCRLVELRGGGSWQLICSITRTPIAREEMNDDCPLIEIDDELFKKAESAYVLQQIRSR